MHSGKTAHPLWLKPCHLSNQSKIGHPIKRYIEYQVVDTGVRKTNCVHIEVS